MAMVPPPRLPHRYRAIAAFALAGPALALPAAAAASPCRGAHRPVASQGSAKAEAAVRCLVNRHRARAGLRPLRYDRRARITAERHTRDMVRRQYFAHTSPGGSTVADRARRTGMRTKRIGENIAVGHRTPASVVHRWMRSSDHRANILSGGFTELGVGASRRGTRGVSGPTWTQVFTRPR